MDLNLEGTRAIITGASRGVGRAIAEELMAEGVSVALCARGTQGRADRTGTTTQSLDEVRASLTANGGTASVTAVDVADHAALAGWVGDVASDWGGIDIVVSNASALGGISRDNDGWRKTFEVDVLSATTLFDAALPHLSTLPVALAEGEGVREHHLSEVELPDGRIHLHKGPHRARPDLDRDNGLVGVAGGDGDEIPVLSLQIALGNGKSGSLS